MSLFMCSCVCFVTSLTSSCLFVTAFVRCVWFVFVWWLFVCSFVTRWFIIVLLARLSCLLARLLRPIRPSVRVVDNCFCFVVVLA